jgi:endonuclease/exonuclease/phosphatase family metal-dependent hydrolase
MSVEFLLIVSGASWTLTNIHALCSSEGRQQFLEWFHDVDVEDDYDWLLVGDFNLIRRPIDRNKARGNMQDMPSLNAAISNQCLEKLKLSENKFTWTNKQSSPLLEKLDWFFVTPSWLANYPGSAVSTLSRDVSDHSPCLISVSTDQSQDIHI